MPERTIKVSAAYYVNPDGLSVLGFQGDKVDVHGDAVKRFDDLNVLPESFIEESEEGEVPLVYPGDAGATEEKPKPRGRRKADSE